MWLGLIMLALEVMDVGSNTLSKAAMDNGLSNLVFVTYTRAITFLYLIPVAFIFHRKTAIPPVNISIICRLLLLGVVCFCISAFFFIGIRCSSPTLASAMVNLSPALTFIMAIVFRMEKLNLSSKSSKLKIIGTIVSITGALMVTTYKGLPITLIPEHGSSVLSVGVTPTNWVKGGVFLATSSIFLSIMYIIRTSLARDFPSEVLITLASVFIETVVAAPITLMAEKDASVWLPSNDIQLIAIIYGALENCLGSVVHTWACGKNGPVYVVMFKPLRVIVAVFMATLFLKEVLYLGSVIGAIIIAIGFYTVMRGKGEERILEEADNNVPKYSSSSAVDQNMPLLHNFNREDV